MATLAWVVDFHPFLSGLGVLTMVLWWRRVDQRGWPEGEVKRLGQYSPAAGVLLVLLVGRAVHEIFGVGGPELGWHLAAGVLAYSWTICGVNKLRQSGIAWAGSKNMALLLAERSTVGPLIQIRLRRWLMNRPGWLRFLGWSGLGIELAGVLFCIPELRLAFSIGLVFFFAFNFLVWGFIELEWALIFLAVALGGS